MKPEAISVSMKIRIVICLLIISLSVSMTGPVCLRAEAIDLNGFGPGDLMRDSGGISPVSPEKIPRKRERSDSESYNHRRHKARRIVLLFH